jgi:glycosyltransferase involved in cell wall biosynthesis
MNILYVSDSTTVSGAEMVLFGYLDRFRPPEHQAHVFLHPANHRLQRALDNRKIAWTAAGGYSRILLETRLDPRALAQYAASFVKVARQMRRVMLEQRTDLVHSISYPASLYAAIPALRMRVPQVWHDHNIKRIHRANRYLYRFTARSCAAVLGPSDAVTANLATAGIPAGKLRTVYNGIDPARFDVATEVVSAVRDELGLGAGTPAVGLFGQMLPYKGHRTLIDAAPAILHSAPGARFFFVGALENPPYQDELRRAIEAAGLTHAFTFLGWRGDIPAVLRAMDAVSVLTTTPEPAALGLMEAMAASRPVVATRTGGTAEIVIDGETGLLVPPGDPHAVSGAIVNLLTTEGLAARFGQAGRHRIEDRFTLDRHLAEMEQIYRDACSSGRPA